MMSAHGGSTQESNDGVIPSLMFTVGAQDELGKTLDEVRSAARRLCVGPKSSPGFDKRRIGVNRDGGCHHGSSNDGSAGSATS